ncbi:MAG: IclR family transcriptional regulator [Anaerolineae bacterium]|nr:IclR family transcriptional regulator [Anaerolineae bacterium]MDW8067952.1 IclR family transcriptional regulator [Anaerolineae bacterium]
MNEEASGLDQYNVRAVERAIQILLSFDDSRPERGVTEVAQATGLHKATVHRIMMTLLQHGLLERTADGEKFRLGVRMVDLGLRALRQLDLRRVARPYMEQLVERFGETCDLGIFDRGRVLSVEVVYGDHTLIVATRVGTHLPIHCTASGRVFLAFLPSEIVEPLLQEPIPPCTEKTITCPHRLREELEATRQRGYGIDDGEFEPGIRAVAVPVRDVFGNTVAALAMLGPVERMAWGRISAMAQALMETAEAISALVLRA